MTLKTTQPTFIPYSRQTLNASDIQAVMAVLNSDWITQGPALAQFEKTVAQYCGAPYAVAVSSATAGLHLACLAAGLGGGDWLWTSPNTFVASANCGRYCGAGVDFVDIDAQTYNLSVDLLEEKLQVASRQGTLPKVLVAVHFAGQSCEMAAIGRLAETYGISVIEDASHALGGSYLGAKIGNCPFSEMTVFSFHPVKPITTGEGGIILTRSEKHYRQLMRLRTHGITRNPEDMHNILPAAVAPWEYQQIELGFNYRLSDIHAALGVSQMKRLDEFTQQRQHLAERYNIHLSGLPLTLPWQHPETQSAHHLYVIRLQTDALTMDRRQVFEAMRQEGIGVNVHYIPVHTQPYYRAMGFAEGDFPQAEAYYQEALTLPLYPDLTFAEQDRVINALRKLLA